MAMSGNVVQDIILGLQDGERASDALHMCLTVAVIRFARDKDFRARYVRRPASSPLGWSRFDRLLYGAGTILCPIFDPLKHEDLADYAEQMVSVRRSYEGIALDTDLKSEFDKKVQDIDEIGGFDSLRKAAELELPQRLRRSFLEKGRFS